MKNTARIFILSAILTAAAVFLFSCKQASPSQPAAPTASPTPYLSATKTPTPTITETNTISPTFSDTPTHTATMTVTETHTITQTHTITETHTVSPTITPTFTITMTYTATAGAWQIVGAAGFTADAVGHNELDIDGGNIYVAYGEGPGLAHAMMFSGSAWTALGGQISPSYSSYICLSVDSGVPYVAYTDNTDNSKACVKKYTGTWIQVGSPSFSPGQAMYLSLETYAGVPYIAFNDQTNSGKISVMKYTGNGATGWEYLGSQNFSQGNADFISLAIYNGDVYVAYSNGSILNNYQATVMKYTGNGATGWEQLGDTGAFGTGTRYNSLYIYNGVPYLGFTDYNSVYGDSRPTVMWYNGSSWSLTGWLHRFSNGSTSWTNLQVYNGNPHIVYTDNYNSVKATLAVYLDGGGTLWGWEEMGGPGFTAGQADYISMKMSGPVPYVSFRDGANGNKLTVMKYE